MPPADLAEHFSCWPGAAAGSVRQPLADGLMNVGAGRNIQQALIGRCVLHDGGGLALR